VVRSRSQGASLAGRECRVLAVPQEFGGSNTHFNCGVWSKSLDTDVPTQIVRWLSLVLRPNPDRDAVNRRHSQTLRRVHDACYRPAIAVVAALFWIPRGRRAVPLDVTLTATSALHEGKHK
jgi:hypothetical protein